MRASSRGSGNWDFKAGPESRRLELERRPDVHRLAVPAVVLERRQAIPLDVVANAASHGDATGKRIGAADIDRISVALAKRRKRLAVRTVGADVLFGVMTPGMRPRDLTLGRRTESMDDQLLRYWTWGTRD